MKRFHEFRLDTTNQCLWRGEERLSLTPKAFDLLRYLVEHADRLVTQEEILEALWTDTFVNQEVVKKLGFELFLKRAKIGQSKHVRVRPFFLNWSAVGSILVMDSQITREALTDILEAAGAYKGLGDWRPSSKTPGPYGTFSAIVTPVG